MITATQYIGKTIYVKIDRPLGSKHPKHGFVYPLNYGFVPNTVSGDGEELDAYVLGINQPLADFTGKCIAVIHRTDDDDDKLIIVPQNSAFADEEIEKQTAFQEQWFKHILIRNPNVSKTHFGIYGIIRRNNQILLIKKTRGPYTGMFDLPGGSPEKGENEEQTLRREIAEETGCAVINFGNRRFKSVIFGDFTPQSGEHGVLQHNAVLFDIEISGTPLTDGDGRDSGGCVWIDAADLNAQNATPYALIGADKPLISVSDENDNTISTHIRNTPLLQGRYIMVAAILMFNSRGNLIMQKIAAHKDWGGLLTYSAAGHVDAGETYEQAAVRELKEEMNVSAQMEKELPPVPVFKDGKLFSRHHVFITRSDAKITPDPFEVAETKEISLPELKAQIKANPDNFFPPFVAAINNL